MKSTTRSTLINRLRLKQFEIICGVADGMSFRMLADQMALSGPAISKIAREAEVALGAAVFERKRDGVVLTPLGWSLVHHSRLVLKQVARIESKLDAYGDAGQTILRLGAPSHTTVTLLAKPLAALTSNHPKVRLEVIDGTANALFELLLKGDVDFIVGSLPARLLTDDEAALLHVEPLYHDEVKIMAHPSSIRSQQTFELSDLQGYAWVFPQKDSLIHNALRSAMLAAGLSMPRPTIETSFIPLIGAMVAEQPQLLGAVRSDAAHYLAQRLGLTIVTVKQAIPLPGVAIVHLKDGELAPIAQELFQLVRDRAFALLN
ncbi:LysR substrate-binding domain-containing protein [Pusillimonas sp. SM2304]|uniref:LysR family transcriptional regulator n=1 Tax=Pusillimonas sp. SM2304 TaxID=3073241 RepID=UPI00287672C4|nr:LysR substrate-binding domain-containing protein [Pusillimonas sp. SM2304]MDS1140403.1 LysR substrate-binding domain-containing protein [Pusillimonas sp. SM2304]